MLPPPLQNLLKTVSKLPGLGPRSAQRTVLHLLQKPEKLQKLQQELAEVASSIQTCQTCGNFTLNNPCDICTNPKRDPNLICVIEHVDDLWAMERSGTFQGKYHVLGGVLNALDGIGPDQLTIKQLEHRITNNETPIQEVILALSAGIDGQTTAHLLASRLTPLNVKVTSLAKGIPMGASVDYLDEGTLQLALAGRVALTN